jgi:hypothetical protein
MGLAMMRSKSNRKRLMFLPPVLFLSTLGFQGGGGGRGLTINRVFLGKGERSRGCAVGDLGPPGGGGEARARHDNKNPCHLKGIGAKDSRAGPSDPRGFRILT